jgi:hypothetical protein
MTGFFTWLARNKDIGVLLLRLFIGFRLIYGVLDNILYWPDAMDPFLMGGEKLINPGSRAAADPFGGNDKVIKVPFLINRGAAIPVIFQHNHV